MKLFPAIDIYEGCAVRLLHGDYNKMTVYSPDPVSVALKFKECGCEYVHTVDLGGARDGSTPGLEIIAEIKRRSGLFCEAGGGERSMETIEKYINAGIDRVILGTSAVNDEELLLRALDRYGEKIAVGADVRSGRIAIKGWLEEACEADVFFEKMQSFGVKTLICTDVGSDGALGGANYGLYRKLVDGYDMDVIASGGVSCFDDLLRLRDCGCHGAIIGRAYYENKIDLGKAVQYFRDN